MNSRPRAAAALAALTALALSSCTWTLFSIPSPDEIARVRIGSSTRDVLEALGLPNRIARQGATQTWTYFSEPNGSHGRSLLGLSHSSAGPDDQRKDVVVKIVFTGKVVSEVRKTP